MAPLRALSIGLIVAGNPGPFSLSGTNTWIIGGDPAWVVDPGPALPDHIEAVAATVELRGGLGGIALTHDHPDHAEAIPALRELLGSTAPVAAARGEVELVLRDGDRAGPLQALATPGHATDHLSFLLGDTVAFTGDAVLGTGSVFLSPDPHALADYLTGLRRLRALDLKAICPGHGPPVDDPAAKLDEYIAHRLDRERKLLDALDQGLRSIDDLLDAAWPDAPQVLRPAATVTLAAHLDKLADEDRLPPGVERPSWPVSPRG
jgi:glyoxylase-like metal-dependent hydrolase (beta-lactamase superfamily II)